MTLKVLGHAAPRPHMYFHSNPTTSILLVKESKPFKYLRALRPNKRQRSHTMIFLDAKFVTPTTFLLFSMTIVSSQQLQFGEAGSACINYVRTQNTINIMCNASFGDVVNTVNDQSVIENVQDQEYVLKASLQVSDGTTLSMDSNDIKWLKIAGANGIIVSGKIQISGVKITSWDASANDVVDQDMNGTISRAYIQFAASEGAEILNSEFGYLGYVEPGRRGFDLFGGGGPSHDMEIRGSKFHDMWMAFYSNAAYNITIDANEFYNNIKYALDPHTATHDMNITNNWVHHNPNGIICSDDCYNILIEGNRADDNTNAGIFFSRNMTDSIARNNHVTNSSSGILVSESSNNQIYNNTVEGATSEGVLLFNPDIPDDGLTENNHVYNNTISSSPSGIRVAKSPDNILENIKFSNIESSEYLLSGNSSIIIRGQEFDDALITQEGSSTNNLVEILDSGTIEVAEVSDGGDEEGEENDYNTDNTPYRKILGDGDSIIVNS
jgi:poly(beta-D-mannuronate) C5 epimerase